MLRDDLEALTGNLIQGELTPVVINLLKGTNYKRDLLRYLNLCSDKSIVDSLKGEISRDRNKKSNTNTKPKDNSGFSLEEWISRQGVDLSVQRDG